MKTFFLALFSVVALLGLVAPSFASEVTNLERETNGERLARGLPPNPPSRRTTAKRHRQSQAPCVKFYFLLYLSGHSLSCSRTYRRVQKQYVEVRDLNGDVLGFISNGGKCVFLFPVLPYEEPDRISFL